MRSAESGFEVAVFRNVLLIAGLYPPAVGGVPTYSKQVAEAYARAGLGVTVITARDAPVGITREGAVEVHNVHQLPWRQELDRQSRRRLIFWRMFRCAWRCLRARDYDLVHAILWRGAFIPIMLGLGAKTVMSIHGREAFAISSLTKRILRFSMQRVRVVLAFSRPILNQLRQSLERPLPHAGVCWEGLSFPMAAKAHRPPADFARLFCMCRLEKRKNLPGAMQAIRRLIDEGLDVHLFVAGGGRESDFVASERARLGLERHVTLLGRISDGEAVSYYRQCGIFLHPQIATEDGNDIEGFGISIADAMSFGCIPVAGSAGGPSDYICDGRTGFLVDGRSPLAIAECLRTILTNPQQSSAIARQAQRFALEHFSWDRHIRGILALVGHQEDAR